MRRNSVLNRTQSGGATVKDLLQHYVPEDLPFGGIGASGMGSDHGRDGFLTFSHARAICRQSVQPMFSMFRPPFTDDLQQRPWGDFERRHAEVAA